MVEEGLDKRGIRLATCRPRWCPGRVGGGALAVGSRLPAGLWSLKVWREGRSPRPCFARGSAQGVWRRERFGRRFS